MGCFCDQPRYLRYKHPDNIGWYDSRLCSNSERETWKTIVGNKMFVNLLQNIWLWIVSSFDRKPSFTCLNAFFAALTVSILVLNGVGTLQYSISWSVTVWRVCIHDQISEEMSNLLNIFLFPFNTRLFFFVSSILQKYMFGFVLSQICLRSVN